MGRNREKIGLKVADVPHTVTSTMETSTMTNNHIVVHFEGHTYTFLLSDERATSSGGMGYMAVGLQLKPIDVQGRPYQFSAFLTRIGSKSEAGAEERKAQYVRDKAQKEAEKIAKKAGTAPAPTVQERMTAPQAHR